MTHVMRLFTTMGTYKTCELHDHMMYDRYKLKLARYSDECERTVRRCLHITIFNPTSADITHYTYLMSMDDDNQVDALIDWMYYVGAETYSYTLLPVEYDTASDAWCTKE